MPGPKTIAVGRPPIVAVVGHIDHGKSTLLDYIRKTSVVEGEAGGITQHLSAYEAPHTTKEGVEGSITFLDTPGHEAFRAMRSRGLGIADVAILVVSAEEGAKPQTLEALKLIQEAGIPYVVAFTKIDKPGANLERAKMSMLESQVFLEGMGGDVPFVAVSGKSGEGVSDLLDLILLAAELKGIAADATLPGSGVVIEAHVDPRRGNTATLIVQNGTLEAGEFVVAGGTWAPTRIMENFLGTKMSEARPGQPVRVVGFSALPRVGDPWKSVETKREAEEDAEGAPSAQPRSATAKQATRSGADGAPEGEEPKLTILPLVIKTDVAGTAEAVVHELDKVLATLPSSATMPYEVRVLARGVGSITDGDIKLAGPGGIVVGFNVKIEREAADLAERNGIEVKTFDIIYKLAEWLGGRIEARRPRERVEEVRGSARVVKIFTVWKGGRIVLGGRVDDGRLRLGDELKIWRRDVELGTGKILSLQSQKREVKEVEKGAEFGAQLKTDALPAAGDRLEPFEIAFK
ncbi:MAG: GTP-binding protein [Patescibacteria group bacterium]|nr:GTP-binding protein [Patescibacteria group bacterium]